MAGPSSQNTAAELPATHSFIQRMESDATFEEITSFSRMLKTPGILNVGRRTWVERHGNLAISAFYLDHCYTGYPNLIHGGIIAALIDEICAEYCNRGAPALYPLTKCLNVEFEKPSPPGEFFVVKVVASRPFPFSLSDARKVWVDGVVLIPCKEKKFITMVKAEALFILCKSLPEPNFAEAGCDIEELFCKRDQARVDTIATAKGSRFEFNNLRLIIEALVSGLYNRKII